MSVFVGDCAVIQITDNGQTVTLDIEKIENDIAHFGNCRGGYINIDDIILEDGDILEEDAIVNAIAYWSYKDEKYPLKLTVRKIDNGFVSFKYCEGSVPLKFLTDSLDVQIWGKKMDN